MSNIDHRKHLIFLLYPLFYWQRVSPFSTITTRVPWFVFSLVFPLCLYVTLSLNCQTFSSEAQVLHANAKACTTHAWLLQIRAIGRSRPYRPFSSLYIVFGVQSFGGCQPRRECCWRFVFTFSLSFKAKRIEADLWTLWQTKIRTIFTSRIHGGFFLSNTLCICLLW